MSSTCLFCRIGSKEIPSDTVFEDDQVFAFKDISPKAPTHVLICPRKHVSTLNDLTPRENELVGHMVQAARNIAASAGIAESGYRTVFNCNSGAGQTVFHIHLHLLGGRPLLWPPG